TQSTTISNTADLIITKIAPPTVTAGGDIIYQIVVGNLGPNTATNVLLLDNFPPIPQITFGSIIAPPGWNPVSVPFLGTPGPFSIAFIKATLTPGEGPQVFIFVVHTIGNIANDILVNNTAVVSGSAQTFDPVSGNNTSTATTNIIACNIICPGDITVNTLPTDIDCGTIVTYPDATTTGSCGTLNYSKASGTFFPVGTTTVTVTSPATGQSCTFNVTVKDNTPPVPNCPADYSVNADPGQCSATVSFLMTATDNCELISTGLGFDGPLSVGSHTFSKTFTDVSGNSASCSFTVTVVDNQPPVITCQPGKTVNADAGKCYASAASVNLVNPTATDNCGSTSINGIRSDGKLLTDNYPTGATVITWTATDAHSNTASCTQTITVKDNQPPAITGISATPSVLWPPNHTMRDVTISYSSADNCGIANCSLSVSSNEPIDGTGDGDTSPDWIIVDGNHLKLRAERSAQGNGRIYTITITCTDISGNSTSQTVNVVVSHNITAPLSGNSFKIGSTVNFAGTFWDKPGNKHTAQWLIDNTSVAGTVTAEPSGLKNGTVAGSYKFGSAGVYKLQMNVKDQNGVVSYANTNGDMEAIVVIYDPNGGYAYGGGYFMSPSGSLKSNSNATGKVSYGFNSNYFKGATNPKGETQMQFQVGNLEFNALNFDYLSINGAKAQFKGSGKITGDQSGYNFIMTVIDGGIDGTGTDKIRLKIYNKNTGVIIYDNQPGASDAADPTTAVGNGSTVVIVNPTVTEINTITSATTTVEVKDGFHAQIFDAAVMPNPTTDNFRLQVITTAKEQIQVKVVDILGRQVKQIKFAPYQTIQFGSDLKKGIYMVEITQGTNHKVVKLQKL
ncbi:MAG: HYR domain-containing protein, partial [Sphingobacteriales bacterium]